MSNPTELLRRALEHLEWCDEECCNEKLEEQIRAFLAAEPEAEPVAYLFDADSYCDHAPIKDELVQSLPKGMLRQKIKNVRPLYTRPEPARKPLSDVEIADIYYRGACFDKGYLSAFAEGFRQAERKHEIGRGLE